LNDRDRTHNVSAEITIENSTDAPLHLMLEPWANEHDLLPGGSMRVTLAGPDPAEIGIEVRPDGIMFWGWVRSTLDDHVNAPGAPMPGIPGRPS
jgi:hypothetical protein